MCGQSAQILETDEDREVGLLAHVLLQLEGTPVLHCKLFEMKAPAKRISKDGPVLRLEHIYTPIKCIPLWP